MKLEKITDWLDRTLKVSDFDDVSNNGVQIERDRSMDEKNAKPVVAFAVDASVRAVKAAANAGAQLLVVHHGISWGGGIRRVSGGVGRVIREAVKSNIEIYACHLPLDAHERLGNNAQLAKLFGLRNVRKAFSYHGNVIGFIGEGDGVMVNKAVKTIVPTVEADFKGSILVGVCSGGAGEFVEEAKLLGCDVYITGEASWGDMIAAENCGMTMLCLGHYETEVFGVRAVAAEMRKALKVKTVDLTEELV